MSDKHLQRVTECVADIGHSSKHPVAARLMSIALQHGAPLEKLGDLLSHAQFAPFGPVSGHDRIKILFKFAGDRRRSLVDGNSRGLANGASLGQGSERQRSSLNEPFPKVIERICIVMMEGLP
jgi:hypothetical protein